MLMADSMLNGMSTESRLWSIPELAERVWQAPDDQSTCSPGGGSGGSLGSIGGRADKAGARTALPLHGLTGSLGHLGLQAGGLGKLHVQCGCDCACRVDRVTS